MKEKTGALWSVPFLLGCIFSQRAGLYRIEGEANGWLVVERIDQGAVWMSVWVIEGEGLEHFDSVVPLIDDLAKSLGVTRWRCEGRKGWAKWLKPVATVYERELT